MKRDVAVEISASAEPLADLQANLVSSALGMEALMDLMAAVPAEHHVRTEALHALLQQVADQLQQAQQALHVARATLLPAPG